MFNLKPFQDQSNNFFELFNSMEKSFFNDMGLSFSEHRAQFYDEGSHYRLEVDLPGQIIKNSFLL